MKPMEPTVADENEDVHLLGKCSDKCTRTVENPSSLNIVSSKKKYALQSRVAYDNVYTKKPIFRRKLIEKYSTARYNFNTKRAHSLQTVSKKKCIDSSYSSAESVQTYTTDLQTQFSLNAEKPLLSNRRDTPINNTDCRGNTAEQGESSVSSHNVKNGNLEAKLVPSAPTFDGISHEKTFENTSTLPECKLPSTADIRCGTSASASELPARSIKSTRSRVVRSDLRALVLSRLNLTESGSLVDLESSKNLETASSSISHGEDSDSCESTYLTISYDGDSDSRFSIVSDEYSEESHDCSKSGNVAATFHGQFDPESTQKAETGGVGKSTAKQSDTIKNAESDFSFTRSHTNAAGLKLSDSDSDSGLQLCSSDGEKSCSDQLQSDSQNVDFTPLENTEKSHRHLLSLKNTNDWVKNSSQNPGQFELNSVSNIQASSAQIVCTDRAGEHLPSDVSVDVSNSTILTPSSFDGDKIAETKEAHNLAVTSSKRIIGSDEPKSEVSNQEPLPAKVIKSLNYVKPEKSNFVEIVAHSKVYNENSCQDSIRSNQTLVHDEAATSKFKRRIEKWKLVPSTIYQHLAEHYEMQKKDWQMPKIHIQKRKKAARKRRWSSKRSLPAKNVLDEPVEIPRLDPYVDALKELEIKKESTNEPSAENIGLILHVGVNRPLFPEVYRNIVALNEETDGQITELWADFALTTLITDKSTKRFRSVFLPVKDTQLKSAIDKYQQETSCKFPEVDLQKVSFKGSPEEDSADSPSSENVCTRKRNNAGSLIDSNTKLLLPEVVECLPKKRKTETSTGLSSYQAGSTIPVSAPVALPKSNHESCLNNLPEKSTPAIENSSPDVGEKKTANEYPVSAAEYSKPTVEKLSDEALLAKHGYKPCWVLLPRISIPRTNIYTEEEEEDDNAYHFFYANHCSRTYGQMFDYRSRNLSLVFFHRIQRILRLQKQNNKLFRSCQYVRLRSDIDDEFHEVDLLDDCLDTIADSKSFPAEVTRNPLDILKTCKLRMFEAPLLRGIDVNACKFPIRFTNHQLLKTEINAKWFILQLNKCLLNVTHQDKDLLPVELLFQIICRADLTKKVVCHTVGMEFNPDSLNFGVYGIPGLCEAVLIGPYESREMQHDLVATVQLWNGETARIPLSETSFDANTFFLWSQDTKMRSVYGLWWKPGDDVPSTSAVNSAFLNHLFNPIKSQSSTECPVKVQTLLRQHPCITHSKYQRGGHDVNIRLIHQASKFSYTESGMKVSERMAVQDFIVDDSPLLQLTKLRSRTNMPNYCEMVSPKTRVCTDPKSDVKKELKMQVPSEQVRVLSISERLIINTENERQRRKEFAVLRSHLRSTIEASQDASLVSILDKARGTIKSLEEDEIILKRTKRSLLLKRKELVGKLRADMRQFSSNHLCYRYSLELILSLSKCDRAESFAKNGLSELAAESVTANIATDDVRLIEPSKVSSTVDSRKQHSIAELSKQPSVTELSNQYSVAELSEEHSMKNPAPVAAPRHSKLKRTRNDDKYLWGKVVESRLESRQPRTPVAESFESCSPGEAYRSEHSYTKRGIGLRRNGRWASSGIPRKEYQKLMSTPPSLLIQCDQRATDSSNERDQVAVYLTENNLPVAKLIIQRLKSANENSAHLSPTERRNQIIALIRKIVGESLTGARSPAGSSNQDERFLVPRLLLLQRLLEGANIQIRDCSKIRVIDEAIEINDDEDEFSIESTGCDNDADNADGQMSKSRVYVQVSSASPTQSNSSPLQNGITLTNFHAPVSFHGANEQMASDAATVVDDQMSVENQIILNSDGDQVDISTYIDNGLSLKPAKRRRGPSKMGKRKINVIERVINAVPTSCNGVTDANSFAESQLPHRVDSSIISSRSKVGSSNCDIIEPSNRNKFASSSSKLNRASNGSIVSSISPRINWTSIKINTSSSNSGITQRPQVHRVPISEVRRLRDILETPVGLVSPEARVCARKTFSSPNFPKLITQRRATREMLCESTNLNDADHVHNNEFSDSFVDPAEDSSVTIDDYLHILPDLLDKPSSPKSSVTKFKPNILLKSYKANDSSVKMVLAPLSAKKISPPLVLNEQFTSKERLRCPSFVPPSVFPTSLSKTVVEKEVPTEIETSPVEENAVRPLEDDANKETVDDGSCVENGSPIDEPSMSRRSSVDSSTRLAIKSFASVHSFNDNCFNNMDRMLKF